MTSCWCVCYWLGGGVVGMRICKRHYSTYFWKQMIINTTSRSVCVCGLGRNIAWEKAMGVNSKRQVWKHLHTRIGSCSPLCTDNRKWHCHRDQTSGFQRKEDRKCKKRDDDDITSPIGFCKDNYMFPALCYNKYVFKFLSSLLKQCFVIDNIVLSARLHF